MFPSLRRIWSDAADGRDGGGVQLSTEIEGGFIKEDQIRRHVMGGQIIPDGVYGHLQRFFLGIAICARGDQRKSDGFALILSGQLQRGLIAGDQRFLFVPQASLPDRAIHVTSVMADMGRITPSLSEYDHRHIAARPNDVEDMGSVILTFSDDSRAVVLATDTLLGGSKNYVELYCNDAAINCNLTMSNMMQTYFLDEDRLDDVYLSEMLPSKTGWNNPFLEDEIMRGYSDEMRDFMHSIYYDHEPQSGFDLAYETIRIIYLAYLSAELGRKIDLEHEDY